MKISERALMEPDGFRGCLYSAGNDVKEAVILIIGDDEKDILNKMFTKWLVNCQGLTVLCIPLRQRSGDDTGLHSWPLEYIEKGAAWLRSRGYEKTGILGMSMQASLALSAAARIDDISLVIGLTACDFVPWGFYHGRIGKDKNGEWPSGTSAFSWRGEDIPFQPACRDKNDYWNMYLTSRKEFHEMHTAVIFDCSEDEHPLTEDVMIPVEDIRGTVVLTGARDDSMWDTVRYMDRMEKRLGEKGFSHPVHMFRYDCGTHLLMPERLLSKGLPLIGGLVSRIFVSGRKNAAACRSSREQMDRDLTMAIEEWKRS